MANDTISCCSFLALEEEVCCTAYATASSTMAVYTGLSLLEMPACDTNKGLVVASVMYPVAANSRMTSKSPLSIDNIVMEANCANCESSGPTAVTTTLNWEEDVVVVVVVVLVAVVVVVVVGGVLQQSVPPANR